MRRATGTRVTVVARQTITSIVNCASAVTAHSRQRVTLASRVSKRLVVHQTGKATRIAMTTTTTLVVPGMVAIAAAKSLTNIARNVNVRTARMSPRVTLASRISRKPVAPRNSRVTATATTTTIMAAVLGTAVTVVEPRRTLNFANCASVWIVPRSRTNAKARRRAAVRSSSGKTRIVTTRTIIVAAVGMEVTVVQRPTVAQ